MASRLPSPTSSYIRRSEPDETADHDARARELLRRLFLELEEGGMPARVEWDEHYEYMDATWKAGQHLSCFAPTGRGKSRLGRELLPLWQRYSVLMFLNKPRNSTLAGLGRQVSRFPGWDLRLRYAARRKMDPTSDAWEKDPEWFRLVPPKFKWSPDGKRTNAQWQQTRRIFGEAMDRCYQEGGWVEFWDEVRSMGDGDAPRLNLTSLMETQWELGREQPITIMAFTQSPRWVPGAMYDQASHFYFGRMKDVDKQTRLGEIGGDTKQIRAVLPTLKDFEFLYVSAVGEGRMEIVKAP